MQPIRILKTNSNHQVIAAQCDVRDPVAVKEALQKVTESSNVPDIVINNAAGNFISPTERLSPNAFSTIIDIVLKGSINVTLEAGKMAIAAEKVIFSRKIETPCNFAIRQRKTSILTVGTV